jgi:hypothetical protein
VVAIAACGEHSMALRANGTLWAWGGNGFGQLGDGTTTSRLTPVQVTTLGNSVGLIACGLNHSLAVKAGGALYAWGVNFNGQLGDGTGINRPTPQLVATPTDVVAIAGGGGHSAAIKSNGQLFVWGNNFFGQVGNRSGNFNPQAGALNVLRGDSVISTGTAASGGSGGTASSSGSSVIEIAGMSTGYDFGTRTAGTTGTVAGKFRNQAASASINGISISVTGAAFSLSSNTCPSSLGPSQECEFAIAFTPPGSGTAQGQLEVASSLEGSPEHRSLIGSAVNPAQPGLRVAATAGLAYLLFAPQTVGASLGPAAVTVTNTGTGTLTVSAVTMTEGASDFGLSNGCISVAAGASCTISITFTPSAANERRGLLAIVTNAGTAQVSLSGTGVPAGTVLDPDPPRLGNISTRGNVLTGNDVMIGGFVIGGAATKRVAIVATGPSLSAFGITNPLANPTLTLVRSSDQAVIATNDNWQSASNQAELTAAGFAPSHAPEAAILVDLAPGPYTAIVQGAGGGTGVSVVAVYEVDGPTIPLINISTRGRVGTGNDVMIGGFVIQGSGPQTVAVVATGPSLANFGITNPLANPTITVVRSSDQSVVATNDDWQAHANASQLQAAGFAPSNALESGIFITLQPGAYTAIVSGMGGGVGVAVVGVYKVN